MDGYGGGEVIILSINSKSRNVTVFFKGDGIGSVSVGRGVLLDTKGFVV